jgi:hypothetical protein
MGIFVVDPDFRYYSVLTSNNITLFNIASGAICSQGTFMNGSSQVCTSCGSSCATCVNLLACTSCPANYELDASNFCVLISINSTNSTANASANTTGPTASIGTTGTYLNVFRDAINLFLENNVFRIINKIPGGRKISPLLCFLINLDELWLYQYHERDYGSLMNDFFDSMQRLEN